MPILVTDNATGSLAATISAGATSFALVGGQGAKFPAPANSLEVFYVRLGTDSSNEVVKCTARSIDTITCLATANGWPSGTGVALTLNQTTFNLLPQLVTANTMVTVKSAGGDFTTLANCITALQKLIIAPGATVTVQVDDGLWSLATPIRDADFLTPQRILWTGKNTYAKALASVYSSSGSAGAWAITLALSNVTNVAVGDYAQMVASSGGTNPTYVLGCHYISNVDAVNSRITVTIKNRATSAPSGAVTGTVTILKTALSAAGMHGFEATGPGFAGINNLALVGDGTAACYGLYAHDGGKLVTDASGTNVNVGVTGFSIALYAAYNGVIKARYAACVGIGASNPVVQSDTGSLIDLISGVSEGGQYGIYSYKRGTIDVGNGVVTGHATNGLYADAGGYNTAKSTTITFSTTHSPTVNTVGNDNSYNDT